MKQQQSNSTFRQVASDIYGMQTLVTSSTNEWKSMSSEHENGKGGSQLKHVAKIRDNIRQQKETLGSLEESIETLYKNTARDWLVSATSFLDPDYNGPSRYSNSAFQLIRDGEEAFVVFHNMEPIQYYGVALRTSGYYQFLSFQADGFEIMIDIGPFGNRKYKCVSETVRPRTVDISTKSMDIMVASKIHYVSKITTELAKIDETIDPDNINIPLNPTLDYRKNAKYDYGALVVKGLDMPIEIRSIWKDDIGADRGLFMSIWRLDLFVYISSMEDVE